MIKYYLKANEKIIGKKVFELNKEIEGEKEQKADLKNRVAEYKKDLKENGGKELPSSLNTIVSKILKSVDTYEFDDNELTKFESLVSKDTALKNAKTQFNKAVKDKAIAAKIETMAKEMNVSTSDLKNYFVPPKKIENPIANIKKAEKEAAAAPVDGVATPEFDN